ncbi:MAG: hypothetical protein IKR23_04950 [Lachnospiraceae bacterium]|nr:hypothetical protein [Lachnospiraceae bacterium]
MKKRLLAALLSFTMLTAQVLPVIAADDADVAVSADAAAEEETGDSVSADEPVFIETDAIETEYEEDALSEAEGEISYDLAEIEVSEDTEAEEAEITGSTASHISVGEWATYMYDTGVDDGIEIDGTYYVPVTIIKYRKDISYRGRKIKPAEDLEAVIEASGLQALAEALVTTPVEGINPKDVIKVKFTAKKNQNVYDDSYFTSKFSVDTKLAKKLGIKGKSLKILKKYTKKLNKVAKSKENRIHFSIEALDAKKLVDEKCFTGIGKYSGWFSKTFNGFSHFRARLDDDQPESVSDSTYKKWTKLSKKDFTVKKINKDSSYVYYSVTPNGKNFTGKEFTMKFRLTTGF